LEPAIELGELAVDALNIGFGGDLEERQDPVDALLDLVGGAPPQAPDLLERGVLAEILAQALREVLAARIELLFEAPPA
jgi:hypothetical protein